jgi:hypothetical protein
VAQRARESGWAMVADTPGTLCYANATAEDSAIFSSSQRILDSILSRTGADKNGLNGYILIFQLHSGEKRKDKFSARFGELLDSLRQGGYEFVRVDELLDAEAAK